MKSIDDHASVLRAATSLLVIFSGCWLAEHASAQQVEPWIDAELPGLVQLYQHLHSHPELSYHEQQTAERFASELQSEDIEVTTGVGGHGVVGMIRNGAGKLLMLRCDLDALPVREETGLPYASRVTATDDEGAQVSVMHACGHDVHMTNVVGVARYLARHRDEWAGTVMIVGQPAEERGGGARAMLEDGLFERFGRPDFAVALHVDAFLPAGMIAYRGGYALANVDSCDITLMGRGGHGSYPQGCIDPIVQAAQLIVDLQTIVSREVAPIEPAVITVGSIHGGTKHNIIPDRCHLQLTIRSYSPEVRAQLKEAITRKARAIAESHRAPEPEIDYAEGTPSLFNDEQLVERLLPAFVEALGEEHVSQSERSMGGEDFSRYGRAGIPIFMYKLGAVSRERLSAFAAQNQRPPSLHSAEFYPDIEPALRTGLTSMLSAVRELLPPQQR